MLITLCTFLVDGATQTLRYLAPEFFASADSRLAVWTKLCRRTYQTDGLGKGFSTLDRRAVLHINGFVNALDWGGSGAFAIPYIKENG